MVEWHRAKPVEPVQFKPDDLPDDPELMPLLVNSTCKAVAGYLGLTYGWKIVSKPWKQSEHEELRRAWSALPTASQDIVKSFAKRQGYGPTARLLPLDWLTKRQCVSRAESIVRIAVQAISHEDWLK